ncbi:MAG TPA: NmrA/HSCARG family protein [Balneolales bacterium]|nr:NmrA/HSCARG family protein [Balneolales bacterium]
MVSKRIIAITGATGAQGGGLVRAILNDPGSPFDVRAITRKLHSNKAIDLELLGADVVEADFDDLESLKQAFRGVYGVFCVTNYWEHFSPEKEMAQIANMATAAKYERVRHVVWSTLEDTREWVHLNDNRLPTLKGNYKVPHFDAKGESNRVFTALDVPTTFLMASFYWDNMIYFGMEPQRGQDGKLAITMPMGHRKLPGIAAEDIGKCAYGIFKQGYRYIGKTVGIAGEHLTGHEMAATLSKVLDVVIQYNDVPAETYRSLGFPGADDLGNMFQFYRDFNEYFCAIRNVDESHALNPELMTFEKWVIKYRDRIPIE